MKKVTPSVLSVAHEADEQHRKVHNEVVIVSENALLVEHTHDNGRPKKRQEGMGQRMQLGPLPG